jgi:hypothetical protein
MLTYTAININIFNSEYSKNQFLTLLPVGCEYYLQIFLQN